MKSGDWVCDTCGELRQVEDEDSRTHQMACRCMRAESDRTPVTEAEAVRKMAILIARTSIDATYADCDDGEADESELDDDWHARIGQTVLAALAAKGLRVVREDAGMVTIIDALESIADYRSGMTDSPDDEMRWEVYPASRMFAPVDMTFEQTEMLDEIAELTREIVALTEPRRDRV